MVRENKGYHTEYKVPPNYRDCFSILSFSLFNLISCVGTCDVCWLWPHGHCLQIYDRLWHSNDRNTPNSVANPVGISTIVNLAHEFGRTAPQQPPMWTNVWVRDKGQGVESRCYLHLHWCKPHQMLIILHPRKGGGETLYTPPTSAVCVDNLDPRFFQDLCQRGSGSGSRKFERI